MLTQITPPGPEHISAVTEALKAVVQEHGMKDQDVLIREEVVLTMQGLLLSVLPGESSEDKADFCFCNQYLNYF